MKKKNFRRALMLLLLLSFSVGVFGEGISYKQIQDGMTKQLIDWRGTVVSVQQQLESSVYLVIVRMEYDSRLLTVFVYRDSLKPVLPKINSYIRFTGLIIKSFLAPGFSFGVYNDEDDLLRVIKE